MARRRAEGARGGGEVSINLGCTADARGSGEVSIIPDAPPTRRRDYSAEVRVSGSEYVCPV